MNSSPRIIFMGTPEFAVPSLDILVKNNHHIAGVITAPDKPAGRGMEMQESAIKKYALANGLKILQPLKLKDEAFILELRSLNADLQIVVAFRMLPEVVWSMPPKGTFNLHASLLPQYRGAAPINWAIINGEKESGATTFFLQQEIDTGKIILQDKVEIREDETAGELHDELMMKGAQLVLKTVQAIEKGSIELKDQPQEIKLKTAPKIFKETCRITWNETTDKIYNLIRGLAPYPTAWTILNNKVVKIYKAAKEINGHNLSPGSLLSDNKTFLKVATNDGFILLKEIQLEGKKKMEIEEFLRGFRLDNESKLI